MKKQTPGFFWLAETLERSHNMRRQIPNTNLKKKSKHDTINSLSDRMRNFDAGICRPPGVLQVSPARPHLRPNPFRLSGLITMPVKIIFTLGLRVVEYADAPAAHLICKQATKLISNTTLTWPWPVDACILPQTPPANCASPCVSELS